MYLMLPIIFTAIRRTEDIRHLIWWWAAAASASGLWSFVQFWTKRQNALAQNSDFYLLYVGDRATGFMSHWMTFGAAQMTRLSLLLSAAPVRAARRYRWPAIAAVAVISASIVIGWTRSVWLATAIAVVYLVAVWRPKYLAADSTSADRGLVHLAAIGTRARVCRSISLTERSTRTCTGTSRAGSASR